MIQNLTIVALLLLVATVLVLSSTTAPATAPCAECLDPVPVGTTYCSTRCRNAADRHDEGEF